MEFLHTFQTPRVTPIADGEAQPTVTLCVNNADAVRIVRALDEASLNMAHTPSGWRTASSYRRLAMVLREQAGATGH
jgi:hypothetical protein